MKLYVSSASPFGRKASVVIHERGLGARVRQDNANASPVSRNAELAAVNPLVKIPTLVLDDGTSLYDSPVICEYLDGLDGSPRFFPAPVRERFDALRRQALADGLMDASLLLRYEQALRPEPLRWADWMSAQQSKMTSALDAFEAECPRYGDAFDIGHVATACALGYLDLRFPHLAWREGRPQLAAWFARVSERPSLVATLPKG